MREALAGNMGAAKQQSQAALTLSKGKDVESMSAIALALAGDSAQAARLASDLAKRFPEDTIVQINYLPTIYGALSVAAALPKRLRCSPRQRPTNWGERHFGLAS